MNISMIDTSQIVDAQAKFGAEMLMAMLLASSEGRVGWNDPHCEWWNGDFEAEIVRRIKNKVDDGIKPGDEADIANYMMMLRYLRSRRGQTTEETR